MEYSELSDAAGGVADVADVADVARLKGLSAAKMTTLQRLSSHPKAIGIGMLGKESSTTKRRGSSSSLPPSLGASSKFSSQSPTMATMTRRHSSSSAPLRQLMRRGSTDTTGSVAADFNSRPMTQSRRSSTDSIWSMNEETDLPSFIGEGNVVVVDAGGEGVANMVGRRPSQSSRRRGSSRWKEGDSQSQSAYATADRRSSSTASLRQLMRRGSADTSGACSPTADFYHPTPQLRRRSSASSFWSMTEDGLDQEESGSVADVALSRGLSAAKMETLQRVSSEHKAIRLLRSSK